MKKIKLTRNKTAIVDNTDFEYLSSFKWCAINKLNVWYAQRRFWNKETKETGCIYMHRQIIKAKKGEIVDHINGNGLDNRRLNLRLASKSINGLNVTLPRKDKRQGKRKGVYKNRSKWSTRITVNGKRIQLGTFESEEIAYQKYIEYKQNLIRSYK